MNANPEGEESPRSWRAVLRATPVISSDGVEIGTVHEVLGWDQEDIFHGIVVRQGAPGDDREIHADRVTEITNHKIAITLTAQEVRELEPHVSQEHETGPDNLLDHYLNAEPSE